MAGGLSVRVGRTWRGRERWEVVTQSGRTVGYFTAHNGRIVAGSRWQAVVRAAIETHLRSAPAVMPAPAATPNLRDRPLNAGPYPWRTWSPPGESRRTRAHSRDCQQDPAAPRWKQLVGVAIVLTVLVGTQILDAPSQTQQRAALEGPPDRQAIAVLAERWDDGSYSKHDLPLDPGSVESWLKKQREGWSCTLQIQTPDATMILGVSEGNYTVTVQREAGRHFQMVGDQDAKGTVTLVVEGQATAWPRRHLVTRRQATRAARTFLKAGNIDTSSDHWARADAQA